MNGSAARTVRRDLRRAVGAGAIDVIDQQSQTLRQLVDVSNRSVLRLDALEVEQLATRLETLEARPHPMTLKQRLIWICRGR